MANTVLESTTVGNDVAAVMYNVTCSTAAATAAKTATASAKFALFSGVRVRVTFTNANTAANPTLNINTTSDVPIMLDGTNAAASGCWTAGSVVDLIYNGTSFVMVGGSVLSAKLPVITQEPEDVYANVGDNVTFSVTAVGTGTLSYQWKYRATPSASWSNGGTSASWTAPIVADTTHAQVYCAVTNANGTVNTRIAQVNPSLNIAEQFNSSANYAVGSYCIYNDRLYRCTTAHEGAWNSSNFTAVTVGDELNGKLSVVGKGKNLLDNGYFVGGGSQQGGGKFPVNQRGLTSYNTAGQYGIDRWFIYNSGTMQLQASGLRLQGSTTGNSYFRQTLSAAELKGKTVTFSALVASNYYGGDTVPKISVLHGNSINGSAAGELGRASASMGLDSVTVDVPDDISSAYVIVQFELPARSGSPNTIIVSAVKLELGDTQTLAHQVNGEWVLNDVPDFATELMKCSRYAYALPKYMTIRAASVRTDYIDFAIPLFAPLVTASGKPIIEGDSNIRVQPVTGGTVDGFTFEVLNTRRPWYETASILMIRANKSAHGMTDATLNVAENGCIISSE